uniref:Uncharacterized protein n=2 Tax=Caenorhabditis japonica TaxID=281687 RepID=A0A8R1I317_CAEJA
MKMKNSEFCRNIGKENYKIGNFRRNSEEKFSFPRKPAGEKLDGRRTTLRTLTDVVNHATSKGMLVRSLKLTSIFVT